MTWRQVGASTLGDVVLDVVVDPSNPLRTYAGTQKGIFEAARWLAELARTERALPPPVARRSHEEARAAWRAAYPSGELARYTATHRNDETPTGDRGGRESAPPSATQGSAEARRRETSGGRARGDGRRSRGPRTAS